MSHPGLIYPKMTVIGFGLIGGSIVRAAREQKLVGEVVVVDASPAHRARVEELGLADTVTADVAEGVAGADLVVIATPVLATADVAAVAA
ncbi:prephenate dehydrogenase, partial [Caulobacter sp. AP07]|uniref:prephenate dehydrogenase/arogenate dehydrogenase family protein n=1 Tax=Caulobacter sp. AP07 TaxID=1144304 RepID=UPI000271DF48